jgi:hypothetical protein
MTMKFRGNARKILALFFGLAFGVPTFFVFLAEHGGGNEGGAGIALYFAMIFSGTMFLLGAGVGAFIGLTIDQRK